MLKQQVKVNFLDRATYNLDAKFEFLKLVAIRLGTKHCGKGERNTLTHLFLIVYTLDIFECAKCLQKLKMHTIFDILYGMCIFFYRGENILDTLYIYMYI